MWVQGRSRKKSTAEELLDFGPMMADLGTATKREIHDVNPIGVDNGKGLSAALGICAQECGVVTKLEHMTGLSKRRLLKIMTIPFLHVQVGQGWA